MEIEYFSDMRGFYCGNLLELVEIFLMGKNFEGV
jgi:hypothetical protein